MITTSSLEQDTIVAIATPPGRGGIAIVRLSGPLAWACSMGFLALAERPEPQRAGFTRILEPGTGRPIDEAVVTFFVGPHSYTGEDVLEIAAHGSPVILELLLGQAVAAGARLARPGEFTERAFLHGRLDLTQAEAVRDLIDATTLQQARVAAEQMGGALSRRLRPVKDALLQLVATIEAGIDFAEDDIDVLGDERIVATLDDLAGPLRAMVDSFRYGRVLRNGLTLALVGSPNVGKSSIFNSLLDNDRAIVTATPGTTRDVIGAQVSIEGIPVNLLDTAGLRVTDDEVESIGIEKSREAIASADLVVVVTDATRALSADEAALVEGLRDRRFLVIRNKKDLVRETFVSTAGIVADRAVETSARTGEGIAVLRSRILAEVRQGTDIDSGVLTNIRQHEALARSLQALKICRSAVLEGVPHEMLMLDLYGILRPLDELTGTTTADDVLNRIFSSFCIGK